MILQFVSVFSGWITLSYALSLEPTPAIPTPIPSVGPTRFPHGASNTFLPGGNTVNNPHYKYKYNHVDPAGPVIPILSYSNEQKPDGSYSYSFSTADGKQVQEAGFLKNAYIDNNGEPQGTQVVQGSYAYVSPEGIPIQVTYVADENGFRPSGVHIPADGKALPPLPFLNRRNSTIVDPIFNKFNPYYNRFGAYNHHNDGRYRYDGSLQYDPRYRYDARYQYNPIYQYDSRYQYNPRYRYDGRYQYDTRHPYDPRHPYDSRYNPSYNEYNPFQVASLYNDVNELPTND